MELQNNMIRYVNGMMATVMAGLRYLNHGQ